MKPRSPELMEAQTRAFLSDLLLDVPITRAQGTDEDKLAALERAALFTPVFADWPTPVDGWLQEVAALSRQMGRPRTLTRVALRTAVVRMRQLDLEAALATLAELGAPGFALSVDELTWQIATQARLLVRQQRFAEARCKLDEITWPSSDSWMGWLPLVARAELELESCDYTAAAATLRTALAGLPLELVEERVQCLQSLGFILITQGQPRAARKQLEQARGLLRAAGAWPEVIQMTLAVGSLYAAERNHAAAQRLFAEAVELCSRYPQPQLETLLELARARSLAARGQFDMAVAAALEVAKQYARQGSVIGYASMILFVATLHAEACKYADAYRVLATGVAIAKHWNWAPVEQLLRRRIAHLRDQVVGTEAFDAMVQDLVDRMRTV